MCSNVNCIELVLSYIPDFFSLFFLHSSFFSFFISFFLSFFFLSLFLSLFIFSFSFFRFRSLFLYSFLSFFLSASCSRCILSSQDWLSASARTVSLAGRPMEWVTPLGLPVVQPYHKMYQKSVSLPPIQCDIYVLAGLHVSVCTHST